MVVRAHHKKEALLCDETSIIDATFDFSDAEVKWYLSQFWDIQGLLWGMWILLVFLFIIKTKLAIRIVAIHIQLSLPHVAVVHFHGGIHIQIF